MILVLRKGRSCRIFPKTKIWAAHRLSYLGNLIFLQKTLHKRHDAWAGALWWSCQSPVAHSCGLLNHPNSFHERMFNLIQWHLPPPLNSTVKLSLFTHTHSSPLSLAASLHWCCANLSHYTNNGWTFFRTDLIYYECIHECMCLCMCVYIYIYLFQPFHN